MQSTNSKEIKAALLQGLQALLASEITHSKTGRPPILIVITPPCVSSNETCSDPRSEQVGRRLTLGDKGLFALDLRHTAIDCEIHAGDI
jgi:hypothetical protein